MSVPSPKVLHLNELVRRRAVHRRDGRRFVLTNGCFDLLHVGHVRYLEAARAAGDVLAVAINSDASVRALKGAKRPINAQQDRAEVLAALQAVDYVTIFHERTAEAITAALQPNLYVKGGDYSDDPLAENFPPEGHVAMTWGGQVGIIEFVPGYSTTNVEAALVASENDQRQGDGSR